MGSGFSPSSSIPARCRLPALAAGFVLLYGETAAAADGAESLTLELGKIFTFFFLTLGPNAVIAPFARGTAALEVADRRKVALIATGISLLAVLIAATIGVRVLGNWGISTGALLVAAGIILFLVALESIRSQYAVADDSPIDDDGADGSRRGERPATRAAAASSPTAAAAVPIRRLGFRMAFPYIVSPHGVAVVILVLSTRPDTVALAPIVAMLGGIMLLDLIVMLNAGRIAGSAYVAPVMAVVASVLGVLQAALGVQAVLTGLTLAEVI